MCKKQTAVSHSSTEAENNFSCRNPSDGRYPSFGSLEFGVHKYFIATKTHPIKTKGPHRETGGIASWQAHGRRVKRKLQPCTTVLSCFILIMCFRMLDFLSQLLCCTCLRTNEAVIKMIIKGRSPTMRHVSRTHRVSLDWLFDRIPHTRSQTFWPKDTSYVTNGIIIFVCSTSAISAFFAAPRNPAWLAAPPKGTIRGKQDCGEIQANGHELDQFCCCKFFICEQSDCVEKPGDTQSFKWTGRIIREAWCKRKS